MLEAIEFRAGACVEGVAMGVLAGSCGGAAGCGRGGGAYHVMQVEISLNAQNEMRRIH